MDAFPSLSIDMVRLISLVEGKVLSIGVVGWTLSEVISATFTLTLLKNLSYKKSKIKITLLELKPIVRKTSLPCTKHFSKESTATSKV